MYEHNTPDLKKKWLCNEANSEGSGFAIELGILKFLL